MQRKTTFIVGAGASAEFKFPTGRKLVSEIEQICDLRTDDFGRPISGDGLLWRAFEILPQSDGKRWNPNGLARVATKVRQNMGLAPSIDNFLDSRRGQEGWSEVGKLAIARSILDAERSSELWFDFRHTNDGPSFARFPENWLTELFRILVTRKDKEDFCIALASCRFITFNYDRVIEQFFHQSIKSYFDLSDMEVDELCRTHLSVVHVYGGLGEVSCHKSRYFGRNDDAQYLVEAASKIKTFTEGVHDSEQIALAKDWIRDCKTLIFLGFSFLPLNIRILGPNKGDRYSKGRVLGTSFGMSADNLQIARNILRHEWYGGADYDLEFHEVGAGELIWRHSMFLSEADLRN
ncbi:hypothetical protein OEZ60_17465 [Defluviimonas sp. WL0024]|uniref:SIR2-like domain-containing protein n=1 Tax=Albidovulum salinarum TaxID=2984153 RepID=A0ABT2X8U1_9RHOB|nr:hypothetical protein [Defluviimonas sp. WL0024]MCU9849789.1 hypothetical protein [Defluviimonas sp. WL0024]